MRFGRRLTHTRIMTLAVAVTLIFGPSGILAQEVPAPVAKERVIEVYYGVRKVSQDPPSASRTPILPVSATTSVPADIQPVEAKSAQPKSSERTEQESIRETLRTLRENSRSITFATVNWLAQMQARAQPQPIIVHTSAVRTAEPAPLSLSPTAPWMTPALASAPERAAVPATPSTPSEPNIVILRDAAPAPAATTGVHLSTEMMICIGLALMSFIMIGIVVAKGTGGRIETYHVAPPVSRPTEAKPEPGVRLLGQYNIGEVPTSAQRFDIGPTYQDEQKQKQVETQAGEAALVEQILQQNLAFLAEVEMEPVLAKSAELEPGQEFPPSTITVTSFAEERIPVNTPEPTPGSQDTPALLNPEAFLIAIEEPKFKTA